MEGVGVSCGNVSLKRNHPKIIVSFFLVISYWEKTFPTHSNPPGIKTSPQPSLVFIVILISILSVLLFIILSLLIIVANPSDFSWFLLSLDFCTYLQIIRYIFTHNIVRTKNNCVVANSSLRMKLLWDRPS